MKRHLGILLSCVCILVLGVSACGKSGQSEFPAESGYTDEVLLLGNVNRFAGVVTSGKETKIEKDDSKKIASIKVSVGDTVKKGQVLFVYDGTQANFDYERAKIELEQLQLSLDDYAQQRAELEKEKASAPKSEQLEYTIQIQEIDTNVREANYNIDLKKKEVEKLRKATKHLKVKSPVRGKIQSINLGDASSGGEEDDIDMGFDEGGGDSSQPFIVISKVNSLRVKAYINEENIQSLYEGDTVTIRSRVDDQTWTGTVDSIDYSSPTQSGSGYYEDGDSETTTSSRYPVYISIDNAEGLMLGQHVFVEKEVSPEDMIDPDNMVPEGEDFPNPEGEGLPEMGGGEMSGQDNIFNENPDALEEQP